MHEWTDVYDGERGYSRSTAQDAFRAHMRGVTVYVGTAYDYPVRMPAGARWSKWVDEFESWAGAKAMFYTPMDENGWFATC